jgi:hypothetical protein
VYRVYSLSIDNDVDIVAYTLKAGIMKSQQSAVARQQTVNNNKGMVFSAQSVPMAAHAKMEYVMPSLSNNCTATGKVFSTRSVPRCYKQGQLAAVS